MGTLLISKMISMNENHNSREYQSNEILQINKQYQGLLNDMEEIFKECNKEIDIQSKIESLKNKINLKSIEKNKITKKLEFLKNKLESQKSILLDKERKDLKDNISWNDQNYQDNEKELQRNKKELEFKEKMLKNSEELINNIKIFIDNFKNNKPVNIDVINNIIISIQENYNMDYDYNYKNSEDFDDEKEIKTRQKNLELFKTSLFNYYNDTGNFRLQSLLNPSKIKSIYKISQIMNLINKYKY